MKKNKFENEISLKSAKELKSIILDFQKNLEETIAYSMPAFRIKAKDKTNNKILCCYLICKNHLGFYPYSGNILPVLEKEIERLNLKYSSGALQIPYNIKIPKTLINKILKLRLKEIKENSK